MIKALKIHWIGNRWGQWTIFIRVEWIFRKERCTLFCKHIFRYEGLDEDTITIHSMI